MYNWIGAHRIALNNRGTAEINKTTLTFRISPDWSTLFNVCKNKVNHSILRKL